MVEVARRHRLPLGAQLGHRARHDRGVEVGEPDAAQLEQVAQHGAELVGGRVAHGGEAPVLDQRAVAVGPEVGLGVADVDDEEHGIGSSHVREALRRPRLAPVRHRAARTRHEGACPTTSSSCLPPMHAALQRMRFGARTVPGPDARVAARSSPARGPSCGAWRSSRPIRRCSRPTPTTRAEVERAEEWGDEAWQPMARRLLWRTFTMRPQAHDELPGGLALPAARARGARCWRPLVIAVERRLNAAERGRRRAPTCSRCPATSTASTAGSPTASSAARRSTPPTCRSPRRRG